MDALDVPTDSYGLWLVAFLAPALVVGFVNDSVVEGVAAAVVLAAVAYLYFNYPF